MPDSSSSRSIVTASGIAIEAPAANDPLCTRARVFRLAAAVDAYELCMARAVANWFDADACDEAEAALREVRSHGIALPGFSAHALELCIAHAEVLALLWQQHAPGMAAGGAREQADARRRGACRALKGACLLVLKAADA
jgi:hypothetical protein